MSASLAFDFQSSPWLFTTTVVTVTSLSLYLLNNKLFPTLHGVPGPKPEFLIGNVRNLLLGSGSTWAIWKKIEPYGPLVSVWFGTKRTIFVSDPDITAGIVRNKEDFDVDPHITNVFASIIPYMLISLTGNDWKRHRKALNPLLSNQRMKNSLKDMDKAVSVSIESIKEKISKTDEPIDIRGDMQDMAMDVMGYLVFGHAFRDLDGHPNAKLIDLRAFCNSLEELMRGVTFRTLTGSLYKLLGDSKKIREAKHEVGKIIRILLDEYYLKLKSKNENKIDQFEWNSFVERSFIAQVFNSPDGKDFTDEEMRGEMLAMILAGSETTYSTMGFALKHLSNNPEIQEKLYDEIITVIGKDPIPEYEQLQAGSMPYLDKVMKEVQRLSLVAPNILRSSNKDVTINGIVFAKGTSFWLAQSLMHRNPRYWKDPLEFIPERWDEDGIANGGPINHNAYMPFGGGHRVCFGMKLAILEEKFFLVYLVRNFFFKEMPRHLADKVGEEEIVQCASIAVKNFVALPVLRQ